ncbi:hypothetical protein A2U01_0107540, partial [Trifolium medium]|nr:hypothetical protein [Trifolium medium]
MAARVPPDLSNKMTKLTVNPDHSRCTVGEKDWVDMTRLQQRSRFGVTKSSAASSSSHPAARTV